MFGGCWCQVWCVQSVIAPKRLTTVTSKCITTINHLIATPSNTCSQLSAKDFAHDIQTEHSNGLVVTVWACLCLVTRNEFSIFVLLIVEGLHHIQSFFQTTCIIFDAFFYKKMAKYVCSSSRSRLFNLLLSIGIFHMWIIYI